MSGSPRKFKRAFRHSENRIANLNAAATPRIVPPTTATNEWTTLMQAEFDFIRNRIQKAPLNPATVAISSLLNAYATRQCGRIQQATGRVPLDSSQLTKNRSARNAEAASKLPASPNPKSSRRRKPISKSSSTNSARSITRWCCTSSRSCSASSPGSAGPSRSARASIWLLWFTFALHTYALVSRVYISGRPPITNLYSTAIFIGWAVVLLSLVFESIQRLGLANIVASVIGFITLFLAYNLSLDGDTFIVLQAVLDTQFWLATHVITINLGYAATYADRRVGHRLHPLASTCLTSSTTSGRSKVLRTLYGTLCFAMFFSFVGTVLGGLWGDDSWGRFWGWDPKENGALMIVLWNALVLHARWGGLVKGRGLATLAVGGNIVTTWSYFGVNDYGVGLHAYGGVGQATPPCGCSRFGASQLAIIALGLMPPTLVSIGCDRNCVQPPLNEVVYAVRSAVSNFRIASSTLHVLIGQANLPLRRRSASPRGDAPRSPCCGCAGQRTGQSRSTAPACTSAPATSPASAARSRCGPCDPTAAAPARRRTRRTPPSAHRPAAPSACCAAPARQAPRPPARLEIGSPYASLIACRRWSAPRSSRAPAVICVATSDSNVVVKAEPSFFAAVAAQFPAASRTPAARSRRSTRRRVAKPAPGPTHATRPSRDRSPARAAGHRPPAYRACTAVPRASAACRRRTAGRRSPAASRRGTSAGSSATRCREALRQSRS